MKRPMLIAATGLALTAGLLTLSPAGVSFSQAPSPQYLPIGAATANQGTTAAWFIDGARQRVVYCVATFSGKPSCQSVDLP